MQAWLIYGILAAVFWGSYIIVSKVATSGKYFGVNSAWFSMFMLLGIAVVFIGSAIYEGGLSAPQSSTGLALSSVAGVLWALGMFVSVKALSAGADVSKLNPIYNTNTLIAVLLGILVLQEVPAAHDALRVIAGAVLIVVGAILVSF
jgi:transporter family protein